MLARKYSFGCTDAALTDDELAAAQKTGAEIVHIPLVMGAVVPTYNLPELKAPIRFTPGARRHYPRQDRAVEWLMLHDLGK